MTRSASSDGLGFKVHYASRGSVKRHLSLMPVDVNGQSRHIPEEDDEFTSQKSLGRSNTFSIKNQSRYSKGRMFPILYLRCYPCKHVLHQQEAVYISCLLTLRCFLVLLLNF